MTIFSVRISVIQIGHIRVLTQEYPEVVYLLEDIDHLLVLIGVLLNSFVDIWIILKEPTNLANLLTDFLLLDLALMKRID